MTTVPLGVAAVYNSRMIEIMGIAIDNVKDELFSAPLNEVENHMRQLSGNWKNNAELKSILNKNPYLNHLRENMYSVNTINRGDTIYERIYSPECDSSYFEDYRVWDWEIRISVDGSPFENLPIYIPPCYGNKMLLTDILNILANAGVAEVVLFDFSCATIFRSISDTATPREVRYSRNSISRRRGGTHRRNGRGRRKTHRRNGRSGRGRRKGGTP